MNATILVTPTPWFDTVNGRGGYALTGVPPGRYRVSVWSERLPVATRGAVVRAGESLRLDWVIGTPSGPARSDR